MKQREEEETIFLKAQRPERLPWFRKDYQFRVAGTPDAWKEQEQR